MKRRHRLISEICTLAAVFAVAAPVLAGTGFVRDENGVKVLDFCVSVRFIATPQQLQKIKDAFADASPILADMTDGQMRFGNVSVANAFGACSEAEVWVHPGEDRALATSGLYGIRGTHINMYYVSNFDSGPMHPPEDYAYTLAHEFGHHLWNLRDEYDGPIGCCTPTSNAPCPPEANICDCEPSPGSMDATFCVMDNYFRRGGNIGSVWNVEPPIFGEFTLDEFCIEENHDPDGDTYQHSIHGESCWETIAAHPLRGLQPPAGLPDDPGPVVPATTFDTLSDQSRFALVLDRSGSMAAGDVGDTATRLTRAMQSAHVLINITKDGDQLGIMSFNSNTATEFALTEMDDGARQDAKDSMLDLTPAGTTAIGTALAAGRDLLAPFPDSCNQPVVLLTDGFSNTGPDELDLIDSLISERIPVTTIAVGGQTNEATLMEIASRTGGRYWHVDEEVDAAYISTWVAAELMDCQGAIDDLEGDIPGGLAAGGLATHQIVVDDLTTQLTIVLLWSDSDADLTVNLIAPNGMVITRSLAIAHPEIDFYDGIGQEVYKVREAAVPLKGTWQVLVIPENPAGTHYRVMALSNAEDYCLSAASHQPMYDCNEPIRVLATPQFQGRPLLDAMVTAEFVTPGGASGVLTLVDNGDPANGDFEAGDGTYAARLNATGEPGTYKFIITARHENGVTAEGEKLFAERGIPTTPLSPPAFQRLAQVHVLVRECGAGACCTQAGCIDDVEGLESCAAAGGVYGGSGSTCLDTDGDGVADACSGLDCFESAACSDGNACTCDSCDGGVCSHQVKHFWADANCDLSSQADLADILCVLDGFTDFSACPNGDLFPPCVGDGVIDLRDILAVLDGFRGQVLCTACGGADAGGEPPAGVR